MSNAVLADSWDDALLDVVSADLGDLEPEWFVPDAADESRGAEKEASSVDEAFAGTDAGTEDYEPQRSPESQIPVDYGTLFRSARAAVATRPLLLPWEVGPLSQILGCSRASTPSWFPRGPLPMVALPLEVETAAVSRPAAFWSVAKRRVDHTGWEKVQDRARQHALWRWRGLIMEMFEVCLVGQELLASCLEAAGDAKLRQVLSDTFAGKANSTLNKRARSMIKYVSWC